MRRFRLLAPFFILTAVGCGDTPTVVTNADTIAQQEASQKKADDEERNMKGGASDPAKKPNKPKK